MTVVLPLTGFYVGWNIGAERGEGSFVPQGGTYDGAVRMKSVCPVRLGNITPIAKSIDRNCVALDHTLYC